MNQFNFDTFRTNLRLLIDSRGMTVKDFAEDIGVRASNVHRYLSGGSYPEVKFLFRIADYFNVSIDWIVGYTDSRFEQLPQDMLDFVQLYRCASDTDRQIIASILSKYKQEG